MSDARFCPNCGSTSVEPDTQHTNVLGEALFNTNKWMCNECDYTGIMPSGDPEDFEGEATDMEFEPSEQPTIDTDAGRAYFKYVLYILVPATLAYILYLILSA